MNTDETPLNVKAVHHGRNVKRFREMQGIKQEILADELELNQQQISRLESQEIIKDEMLEKLAKALHITVDAIKKCDDEIAVNIISNTFNEQSVAYQYNFNPIEKIITLYDEKIELYERMLKVVHDKSILLEEMIKEQRQ